MAHGACSTLPKKGSAIGFTLTRSDDLIFSAHFQLRAGGTKPSTVSIGRARNCHVVIEKDGVSSTHVVLIAKTLAAGQRPLLFVRDVSTNGTGLEVMISKEKTMSSLRKDDDTVLPDGARLVLPVCNRKSTGEKFDTDIRTWITVKYDKVARASGNLQSESLLPLSPELASPPPRSREDPEMLNETCLPLQESKVLIDTEALLVADASAQDAITSAQRHLAAAVAQSAALGVVLEHPTVPSVLVRMDDEKHMKHHAQTLAAVFQNMTPQHAAVTQHFPITEHVQNVNVNRSPATMVQSPWPGGTVSTDSGDEAADELDEFLFLPTFVQNVRVLVPQKAGLYLVDNSELQHSAPGLAYRKSMVMTDKVIALARWGSFVKGSGIVANWIQVEIQALDIGDVVNILSISPGIPEKYLGQQGEVTKQDMYKGTPRVTVIFQDGSVYFFTLDKVEKAVVPAAVVPRARPLCQQHPYDMRPFLVICSMRFLLARRKTHATKSIEPRPHLPELLEMFAAQQKYLQVAVWSHEEPERLSQAVRRIFGERGSRRLAFVWSRAQCSQSLGCLRKDLTTLRDDSAWGRFWPHRVLLVDDDATMCASNPVFTAIHPSVVQGATEFEDIELIRLRDYLQDLALQAVGSVPDYVQVHPYVSCGANVHHAEALPLVQQHGKRTLVHKPSWSSEAKAARHAREGVEEKRQRKIANVV